MADDQHTEPAAPPERTGKEYKKTLNGWAARVMDETPRTGSLTDQARHGVKEFLRGLPEFQGSSESRIREVGDALTKMVTRMTDPYRPR